MKQYKMCVLCLFGCNPTILDLYDFNITALEYIIQQCRNKKS